MSDYLFKNKFLYIFVTFMFLVTILRTGRTNAGDQEQKPPDFQRGMCLATWEKDKLASPYSDQALERLKGMGVEYIQIVVTLYQDKYNSTTIRTTERTPSDKSLEHAIRKAHKLGLKVMLKPHIDLMSKEDGTYWRADIGFNEEEDWRKWFKEYEELITHYAEMGEKYDVEILCVGTELSFTTQKPDYWRELISSVRKIYPGKLTYAANWDNYKSVEFWDDLDFIGIDAYFPLTYKINPTVEDIKKGWEKWKYEIESWHSGVNKPIVFTEIGYASSFNAPREPWKNGSAEADVEIQARCYSAFFESIWDCTWLAGVYWWKWAPSIYGGGKFNRQFTPMNKPAEKILEENYLPGVSEDRLIEVITSEAQSRVSEMGMPRLFELETLLPPLRTKHELEFRGEWESKREEFLRERSEGGIPYNTGQ